MKDLNQTVTVIFNIVKNEDGEIVAVSGRFHPIEIEITSIKDGDYLSDLKDAIGVDYNCENLREPDRILFSEITPTPSGVIKSFTATIQARR